MRVPLTGGAYTARSLLASAQRAVNLYGEVNPPTTDPPAPVTQYLTPGLTLLSAPPVAGAARGFYRSSTDTVYAVIGANVYAINSFFGFTQLGTIENLTTPVSMKDNEQFVFLVDGTTTAYTISLDGSNTFAQVTDPNYLGSDRVDYLDTFLLFNQPGTPTFYSTLSNVVTFDPNALYFASMTGEPTNCVAVATLRGYIWVIGEMATEVWYDAGDTNLFPFARMPGQVIQHGCVAKYSIAMVSGDDDSQSCLIWLARNQDGERIVLRTQGYAVARISTHAIEEAFRLYSTVSDATSLSFQIDGHSFYQINFPTANKSWRYDLTTGQWHEAIWTDGDGNENRHRANCSVSAFGKSLCLDWENGNLYSFDLENYTDNGSPIVRRRGFPHLINDGKRVIYSRFIADMEGGQDDGSDGTTQANPPIVYLRWSDDHGHTWGNPIPLSLGATGQYNHSMMVTRLGQGRDRVFELFWSTPAATALNGAWIEPIPLLS